MQRLLLLGVVLGALIGCSSSTNARRICGPLSVVSQAKRIDLRVNDLRHCDFGRNKPARLTRQIQNAIHSRYPEIVFVGEDDEHDLLMIVSVSDAPRGCIFPSWTWTVALDAWLPSPLAPSGGTFAAVVEINGKTRVWGHFVSEAIGQFAAVKEGELVPQPSTDRCAYGLNPTTATGRLTPRWSGRVRDKVPSSYAGVRAAQLNR
jgi:hypothetical protein